jgi:excisionase family DNA binding protein
MNYAEAKPRPLTTRELADHLQVTTMTIANWMKAGKIPVIRITKRCHRFDLAEVEKALIR